MEGIIESVQVSDIKMQTKLLDVYLGALANYVADGKNLIEVLNTPQFRDSLVKVTTKVVNSIYNILSSLWHPSTEECFLAAVNDK